MGKLALLTALSSFTSAAVVPRALRDYTIPQDAGLLGAVRALAITAKRATFLYGPPVAGGPSYPIGALALTRTTVDSVAVQLDSAPLLVGSGADAASATLHASKYDGLDTLEDYTKLYYGEWKASLPGGPNPGALTNYTQDLFFSMERLANSPYQIRRLNPSFDSLEFDIEDAVAKEVTGSTQGELLKAGRLFYADYRDQTSANYPATGTRYAAACDAYFYIDSNGDFLPLAIRPNAGSDLVYTPADSEGDWMLAKIMYNVNDSWFAQWNHLAATHEVVQIAYMAAIRTMSDDHPVLALLNHRMSFPRT